MADIEGVDYAITVTQRSQEVQSVEGSASKSRAVYPTKTITKTATVKVEYSVEHSCDDEPLAQNAVTVELPAGGSALQVMEIAADTYGSQYNFTGKYYGGSLEGFDIEKINGFPNDETPPTQCYWEFLIRFPDGSIKPSKLGVSSYYFDTDGYGMIMCFTQTPPPKMIKVDYYVEPQGNPVSPVSVSIPVNGSALQVMEAAANRYGIKYYFTSKYYGKYHGFEILTIDGIPHDEAHYWEFLIKSPNGSIERPEIGISAYKFSNPGYGMIMRLKEKLK